MQILRSGAEQPDLSVCVPTLDARAPRTQALTHSLAAHTTQYAYEVLLADCEGELLGYTEPQNAAMAAGHGSFLLAVNDDVEFAPGWLSPLLAAFVDPEVWCVTPDATHTDGPQVFAPWCMLWRAEAWQQLGGLDTRFRVWASDIDLARRLVDAGHPPIRVPLHPPLVHQLNGTTAHHPELGETCATDLSRFREKWGVDAEREKNRLAALVTI